MRLQSNDRDVSVESACHIVPRPYVVSASRGGETILLDPLTSQYYALNEMGTEIWGWLCAGQSTIDIATRVSEEYAMPLEQTSHDLKRFVTALLDAALVTRSDA
jgi:Coenzyme PQQ synthesis protein D (PqqD)